jgi:endoglucanase
MKRLSRRRLSRCTLAAGLAVAISGGYATATSAAIPATGELLQNVGFDTGLEAPWWNSANTQSRVEGGQLVTNVNGGTANPYDAQVGQSGVGLTNGRSYTLSFDASASATVSVNAIVQLGATPFTKALEKPVELSPGRKHYILPFTSTIGSGGQVTFQLGGKAAAYTAYLDNISLTPSPLALTSGFYVDPNSNPKKWVADNNGGASQINSAIATKAGASWFGNWCKRFTGEPDVCDITGQVSRYVGAADAADKLPMLVAYNIPDRDCGSHSGGGAGTEPAYQTWISAFARAIGNRPAVVIIEPDALAQLDCLSADTQAMRLRLLRYATEQFRDYAPNTWAYLDGGNATWQPADVMAQRLEAAGVREVRGFSLNVSNFHYTSTSVTYGNAVNTALNTRYKYTRTFVVDTSRNGNGPPPDDPNRTDEWCNPAGRKLGTTTQAGGGAELLLWVKVPGDSDGPCGIAATTPAGQFNADIANRLINGS